MSKVHYRYSAMNAGKSTYLLQVAYNYTEQGHKVALFTSSVDDRYGTGRITSRLGPDSEAEVFNSATDFLAILPPREGLACVLVDEAQFLSPEQVQQLHRYAHAYSVPVLCFGLRSDFRGQPFPGSAMLLALADSLEEIKTLCKCKRKASMNMRVDEHGFRVHDGAQVEIGGNNRYRSVCPRCYYAQDPVAVAVSATEPAAA